MAEIYVFKLHVHWVTAANCWKPSSDSRKVYCCSEHGIHGILFVNLWQKFMCSSYIGSLLLTLLEANANHVAIQGKEECCCSKSGFVDVHFAWHLTFVTPRVHKNG